MSKSSIELLQPFCNTLGIRVDHHDIQDLGHALQMKSKSTTWLLFPYLGATGWMLTFDKASQKATLQTTKQDWLFDLPSSSVCYEAWPPTLHRPETWLASGRRLQNSRG